MYLDLKHSGFHCGKHEFTFHLLGVPEKWRWSCCEEKFNFQHENSQGMVAQYAKVLDASPAPSGETNLPSN